MRKAIILFSLIVVVSIAAVEAKKSVSVISKANLPDTIDLPPVSKTEKAAAPESKQKVKPNVILVMTDDQGYGDLSCHGNPVLKTPNLDRLYSESIRFTDFHVAPFCSPTRAALMTGRIADRCDVWSTVYGRNNLARKEATIADFFKTSGYTTGHFGKWHLGSNYPYRPIDRGFDEWVGIGSGGLRTVTDYWANDRMNDHYLHNGEWEPYEGYCVDIFFDETMKFMKKNQQEGKPCFVYLATNVPHGPDHVLAEWDDTYRKKYKKGPHWGTVGEFLTMIARFDYNMGRLRKFLTDNDLADNTMIVYLTDNGSAQGTKIFNAGMRGGKGTLTEGGHRVPCFIHWPAGGFDQPRDINNLTHCVDLLPTLVDICSLDKPDRDCQPLDGLSLAPVLAGKKTPWDERTIIFHKQNISPKTTKWKNCAVLTSQWRLLDGRVLYDIKKDPRQRTNVAEKFPEVVADLRSRYEAYWKSLKTDEMLKNPERPVIGSEHQKETVLSSIDWIRDSAPHTWNQLHVLSAAPGSGVWPVEIASDGKYRFEVRRWPIEVNKPITAALPAQAESDTILNDHPWMMDSGKAIPAVTVKLKVGETVVEKAITDQDLFAEFSLELHAGNTQVQAWLVDKNGKLQGAYYVYVEKL
ncbi:MAG: arylsulfatase [Planctomycetota bacterium]